MSAAMKARFVGVLTLSLVLRLILPFSTCVSSGQKVNATVDEAEQAIDAAFQAVLNAEHAGANVTNLLAKLNEGADLLSNADMAFEDGHLDEATRLSNLASEIGNQVETEAKTLKVETENAAVTKFWLYIGSSAIAIVAVILAAFLAYRYFKKRYPEGPPETKPKAEEP